MTEPEGTKHRNEPNGIPDAAPTGAASSESPLKPELSVAPNSIEGLFLQALQLPSPEDREAFLDRNCQNEPENRKRVLALLRAHADAGNFLETPAVDRPTNAPISLGFLNPCNKDGVLGTIGPYEVLEAIGRGGMGVVLRAMDLKLNRIVAVKALLPELASNPNSRRRFLREAQAAAAISHPHVVSIHAVDDSDQDHSGAPVPPFLVMECIVGQSLQQKLDKVGPLRLTEILRISRQISDGLAAAHKQGLVHRDIKPANILLENGVERVKITDFGLARAIDDITVTRTGEVCGTPQYMSPEQACGDRVDHRSDLFSLGCVMYAMCTGHSPFRGDSIAHVIKRVTQDEPRSIADQNPEIPAWLTEIISSLLQKSPEHRFQSAESLVEVLDQHLSRIQLVNESGSHSAINQQIPKSGKTESSRSSEPTFKTNTSTQNFNSSQYEGPYFFGPMVQIPMWMRAASFTVLTAIAVCVLIYSAISLGSGRLPNALEMGMVGAFLLTGPLLMSLILCRRTARQLVVFFALFLGLNMFGVLIFALIKGKLKQEKEPDSVKSNQSEARQTSQHAQATSNDWRTDSAQQSKEVQCSAATSQEPIENDLRKLHSSTSRLNYRFAVLAIVVVAASFLILPSLWLVSLATRDAINGNSLSILVGDFWRSVFAQKIPTLLTWGTAISAISLTLLVITERRRSVRKSR